jgi:hypothetical protein
MLFLLVPNFILPQLLFLIEEEQDLIDEPLLLMPSGFWSSLEKLFLGVDRPKVFII